MLNKIAKLVTQRGKLILTNNGSLCLLVPAPIVRGAFASIPDQGTSLPPNIGRVVVMTPSEVKTIGPNNIDERGHEFNYRLGPIHETTGYKGISKIWYQEVKSTELNNLRKSYGLSDKPSGDKFKLIIAIRKTNVLRDNAVSKLEKEPEVSANEVEGPAHVMRIRIFKFSKFGEESPLINVNYDKPFLKIAQESPEAQQASIFQLLYSLAQQFIPGVQSTNPRTADEINQSKTITDNITRGQALDIDSKATVDLLAGIVGIFTDPTPYLEDLQQLANYVKPMLPMIMQLAPDLADDLLNSNTVFEYHIANVGKIFKEVPKETLQAFTQHINNKYFGEDAIAPKYGFTRGKMGRLVAEMAKNGMLPLMYMGQNPAQAMELVDKNLDEFLRGVGTVYNHQPNASFNDALNTVFLINSKRRADNDTPLEVLVSQAMILPEVQSGLRGHFGSIAGAMVPEEQQAANSKLMGGFAQSRAAANLGALIRAVDDGAVAPGSPAHQMVQGLKQHGWMNLDTTQWSTHYIAKLLMESGVESRNAFAYATGTHANLDATLRTPGALVFGNTIAQPAEIIRRYQQFARHSDPTTAKIHLSNWLAQSGLPDLKGLDNLWPGINNAIDNDGDLNQLVMGPAFAYSRQLAERGSGDSTAAASPRSRIFEAIRDYDNTDTAERVYNAFGLERTPADYKPQTSFTDAAKEFEGVKQTLPTFGEKMGSQKYSTLSKLTPTKCFFRSCGG